MKSLETPECIEAKARIFPQEVDEYFQIQAEKTKLRKEKTARLKAKRRELKALYKDLGYYHNKYKRLAVQCTYNHLLASGETDLAARLKIANMLEEIDRDWKSRAYDYYMFGMNRFKTHSTEPSLQEVVSWPGLIGFPDHNIDASRRTQNTQSQAQAALHKAQIPTPTAAAPSAPTEP
jgi:hypothetical protein